MGPGRCVLVGESCAGFVPRIGRLGSGADLEKLSQAGKRREARGCVVAFARVFDMLAARARSAVDCDVRTCVVATGSENRSVIDERVESGGDGGSGGRRRGVG